MRVIGLLGGMSWVSTAGYYRVINDEVAARLGGAHCARLVLWQTDFAEIVALQEAGRWAEAGVLLGDGATALKGAGAEVVGIAANTMHLVADDVAAAAAPARLVHVAEAVRDACRSHGWARVGLLGTSYTMSSPDLYPPILNAAGIEMLVPEVDEQAAIHRATFDELIRDVVTDDTGACFHTAAAGLIERGAEAIVLACTEHGLVVRDGDVAVPVLDTADLHARALVDAALS